MIGAGLAGVVSVTTLAGAGGVDLLMSDKRIPRLEMASWASLSASVVGGGGGTGFWHPGCGHIVYVGSELSARYIDLACGLAYPSRLSDSP